MPKCARGWVKVRRDKNKGGKNAAKFQKFRYGFIKKKTKNKLINNESVGRSVMSDSLGPHGL